MAKVNKTEIVEQKEIKYIRFDNDESRKAKTSVKDFFGDYSKQLRAIWNGLKEEENGFKALNAVISGFAGGENMTAPEWIIAHFAKYVDKNGIPCNRKKDENGAVYYTRCILSGVYARGILKKCALNCIESNRIGNRFTQIVVEPMK